MVKTKNKNFFEIVNKIPRKFVDIRQRLRRYDMTTVCYVTTPDYVLKNRPIFSGKVGAVIIPQERALDIDTNFDLKVARLLY